MPQALTGSTTANGSSPEVSPQRNFWALTLGCVGVVYGDIGTSPLYAMRESVLAATGGGHTADEAIILGILSLIIWALILIVTVKYVLILLRADNNGEGGTVALMALAHRALGGRSFAIVMLGIVSAALFYGDAMITPALSVLSAVEGLEVIAPTLESYVVPLTVVILFALFAVQSRGTAKVAASVRSPWSGSSPSPSPGSRISHRILACCAPSTRSMGWDSWQPMGSSGWRRSVRSSSRSRAARRSMPTLVISGADRSRRHGSASPCRP
jgi:hypothetical protein